MVGTAYEGIGEVEPVEVYLNLVDLFSQITSEQMAEYQQNDNQLGPVYQWVKDDKIPPKSFLYKVRSKTTRKLFYQFDRLVLKKGVLHRLYIHEDMEYHQLLLPQRFHSKVLHYVHDDMGHQGLERTMELLRERGLLAYYGSRCFTMGDSVHSLPSSTGKLYHT